MLRNAIQITHVVYMAKPISLASLKFSGTFLVLMAYRVHKLRRRKSNAWLTNTAVDDVIHVRTERSRDGCSVCGIGG